MKKRSKKLAEAQKRYYEKNRKKLKTKHIEIGTNRLVFQEEDDDLYTWDDNLAQIKVKSCNTKLINLLTTSELTNKIEYDGKNTFVLTPKGREYLENYKRFAEVANTFGLEM